MLKYAIHLVKPPKYAHNDVLRDIIDAVYDALEDLGLDVVETDDLKLDRTYLVFGAHHAGAGRMPLPAKFIAYNFEQINPQSGCGDAKYFEVLRKADEVWDFSLENVNALTKAGFKARYVPVGYTPSLTKDVITKFTTPKDIEILFFGSGSEYREKAFARKDWVSLPIKSYFGVYGHALDTLVARSKVVINLRAYEPNVLEEVRLAYLVANKACVVSESYPALEKAWDGVSFGSLDAMPGLCKDLLQASPEQRAELGERAFRSFSKRKYTDLLNFTKMY